MMAETFDYDVFLSYSSKDRDVVHALAERLQDDGLDVWLDDWVIKPGDPIALKIQRGVEASRVLLMCMSQAYFASEWASLEHHSLLFRDPTNKQRQFIPVLLQDCDRPYAIAQFAYVDWRKPSSDAYEKLLKACQRERLRRKHSAEGEPDKPRIISPTELDELLACARDERWPELALIGPFVVEYDDVLMRQGWPARHIFRLSDAIGDDGARAVAALTDLTSVHLGGNGITAVGASALAALTNVTSLYLWGNIDLGDDGARALAGLANLTSLHLGSSAIHADGARALAALTNLSALDLGANGIGDDGACALAALPNLTSLNLALNGIGNAGAHALAASIKLTSLDLRGNSIGADGARALTTLANLTSLDLRGNSLGANGARALLDAWVDRPGAERLRRLDLRQNGDLSDVLPPKVLETGDAQAILAAYRRHPRATAKQTLQPLNEAKLLVVGNEAVGKTSLIRYLVTNQPRDPSEAATRGAAIHERIETQTWVPEASDVRLNVWDFGGQEIVRGSTHRFFLTARSLYLLVLENRREDDRSVYDWLRTIKNSGGDSPVIVVINKCDDDLHHLRLDESGLRREFPGIVAFVRTSCNPGDAADASIGELRGRIVATLTGDARLKHVRDPIPAPWLRVKDAVTALARERRVLPVREFERLCEQPAEGDGGEVIADPNEQRALLRLLHDLGLVVAHGLRDDARATLREVTLLDPNWLTGAIYALLTSRVVADQSGEFSRDQMTELLDPEQYPARWHGFIIEMMEAPEIGLAFELPGSGHERYLIPEALPANEPYYDRIWPHDSLRFRYSYELLPPGLIPRFIVQAHRNLTEKPTRWRTGVVLGAAGCPVLVRGDRDRRRIDISVAGPEGLRRSALNVVLDDLDEVHALNPEIGARALVPLTDQPELDVSYDHLLRLEQHHGLDHTFAPEDAARPYTVRELLEGVRRDPSVQVFGDRRRRYQIPVVDDNGGAQARQSSPSVDADPAPAFLSWPWISVGCGAAAAALWVVLLLLPSNWWRTMVGVPIGIGVLVTTFMLWRNPKLFYRRLLGYVIFGGLLLNAVGFSFDVFTTSEPLSGWLRWNGAVSGWFFAAWAVVVGCLVWGDVKQSQ